MNKLYTRSLADCLGLGRDMVILFMQKNKKFIKCLLCIGTGLAENILMEYGEVNILLFLFLF